MNHLAPLKARWEQIMGDDPLSEHVPLAPYTSFRVGGPADVLALPTRRERLIALLLEAYRAHVPITLLGGGSNVLVPDEGIRGLVVINRCRGYRIEEGRRPHVWAEAGMSLAGLARALIRAGWDGLTWAVSIPGTVGGAVVGNAGAHGGDMASVLEEVIWLERDGRVRHVPVEALDYGYRTSTLKRARRAGDPFPVVLAVRLRIWPGDPEALRATADTYLAYRRRTQPSEPSVGSVFRNPPGDYAGRLIEAAGLKGYRLGNVAVSRVHANFIINLGGGRTSQVLALMDLIQERVAAKFGIWLEPEILILDSEVRRG